MTGLITHLLQEGPNGLLLMTRVFAKQVIV